MSGRVALAVDLGDDGEDDDDFCGFVVVFSTRGDCVGENLVFHHAKSGKLSDFSGPSALL